MQGRQRSIFAVVTVCLVLAVAPAFAAKTSPTLVPLPRGSFLPGTETNGVSSVCTLGQTDAAAATGRWFFPSGDYYYTLFDPAACGCAGGLTNLVARWTLNWPVPCFAFSIVGIVPAVETFAGSGCYIPAPPAILCGPTAVVLLDGTAGGVINHAVALPPCGCLANGQKAFILFKIVSAGSCPVTGGVMDSPFIVIDASPTACTSYNYYPGGSGDLVTTLGLTGNMVMSVEADCCAPTPTLPGTWGMLKTLYR